MRASTHVIAGAIIVAVLAAVPVASAQDATPEPALMGELDVLDAHIEGSGPWTSWFGGAPSRTLVLALGNRGTAAVVDPELVLTFGRGADPTGFVAPPEIGRLEPGESTIVRVELDLPTFAIGTYAVEGSFPEIDPPLRFRAETSHIPWVPLLLPLIILIQLCLLWARNRLRDRIHRPVRTAAPTPPEPIVVTTAVAIPPAPAVMDEAMPTEPAVARSRDDTEPEPTDLETIVREELDTVFDDAFRRHDDVLDDTALGDLVIDLARTAAHRVAERAELGDEERAQLHLELIEALLAAFDLAPTSPV